MITKKYGAKFIKDNKLENLTNIRYNMIYGTYKTDKMVDGLHILNRF